MQRAQDVHVAFAQTANQSELRWIFLVIVKECQNAFSLEKKTTNKQTKKM